MRKKFLMLTGTLVLSIFTLALPTSAGNTTDTSFFVNNAQVGTHYTTQGRSKENDSSVFCKVTYMPGKYVYMMTQGSKSATGSWISANYNGGYAALQQNINYGILNSINESGYGYARLNFYSNTSGYIEGWWSPDSSQSHTPIG